MQGGVLSIVFIAVIGQFPMACKRATAKRRAKRDVTWLAASRLSARHFSAGLGKKMCRILLIDLETLLHSQIGVNEHQ